MANKHLNAPIVNIGGRPERERLLVGGVGRRRFRLRFLAHFYNSLPGEHNSTHVVVGMAALPESPTGVFWSTGFSGPAGPAGAPGATGPAGPPGSSGGVVGASVLLGLRGQLGLPVPPVPPERLGLLAEAAVGRLDRLDLKDRPEQRGPRGPPELWGILVLPGLRANTEPPDLKVSGA